MEHRPPKMVKASGDSLGFLLILKMEIVNIFLIEGKLLANFLKDAIVHTLKKPFRNPARAACKCSPFKKASCHVLPVIGSHCLSAASE